MARNKSAASAWTDIRLAEKRAARGGRFDGREALALALQRAGFRRDSRAREAYSLPGQEGLVRVDFGGDRSKSATVQSRRGGGSWSNVTDTIYFGYMRNDAEVDGWARYVHAVATGTAGVEHPPIPTKKLPRPETVERRERKQERVAGRGFYVVNATTAGARVGEGGLYLPLAANHGPFATLDEALPVAWDQYQQYLQMRFTYLLPVQIIESKSKPAAERGDGYVWWSDGKTHGAPVPREQTRFANMAHAGLQMLSPDEVARLSVGSIVWSWVRDQYSPEGRVDRAWVVVSGGMAPIELLPERSGGGGPHGEPARTLGGEFVLIAEGRGKLPTHGTAARKAEASEAWKHHRWRGPGSNRAHNPWAPKPEVRKRMTPEQKKALEAYRFAVQQEDRYLGSVFVNPAGQRRVEEATRAAAERCQRLGLGIEHGL